MGKIAVIDVQGYYEDRSTQLQLEREPYDGNSEEMNLIPGVPLLEGV